MIDLFAVYKFFLLLDILVSHFFGGASVSPERQKWPEKNKNFFMMRGHLGQYVMVEPKDNIIIVRLGHSKGSNEEKNHFTSDIDTYISEAYKMLGE